MFTKKYRRINLAFAADGAEGAIAIVVWPLFIYEILNGNYAAIGALSTVVIGLTVVLQLATGRYIDKRFAKEKVFRFGTVLYAFGWVFKMFIATAFQIFIIDVYHRATGIFARTAFGTLMYDFMSKEGHYVDEYTVLREMAINMGRVVILALIIVMSWYFSLTWTFLLAATASVLQNVFIPLRQKEVRA